MRINEDPYSPWAEIGTKPDYPYVPQPFETVGGAADGIFYFLIYGDVPGTIILQRHNKPAARYSLLIWGDLRWRYFRESDNAEA